MWHSTEEAKLKCPQHAGNDITHVCRAAECDNLPLCQECYQTHLKQISKFGGEHEYTIHRTKITPIKKVINIAATNLRKHKETIQGYIEPYDKANSIHS